MGQAKTEITPRLLSSKDAAAYCGMSVNAFMAASKKGILPGRIKGTYRYDKQALDRAIDRFSCISAEKTANNVSIFQREIRKVGTNETLPGAHKHSSKRR